MLIIDGHLDLAMNAVNLNRDLTRPVAEIRAAEEGMDDHKSRGTNTVAFPDLERGRVAVGLVTVLARIERAGNPRWGYRTTEICYGAARGQLAYYEVLARRGVLTLLSDWHQLSAHIAAWERWEAAGADPGETPPMGAVITMEGADPIAWPEQVWAWYEAGLRVVSLAHYGLSTYAHGTGTEGGLTSAGKRLLDQMARCGMMLDVTHLADPAFWEALERFDGPVVATHNNCRALVPGQRQFSDEQLAALIERDGVIGAVFDAWMLYPDYVRGETPNDEITIADVVDQIDHVCQLAGNTRHAAIGSDLDGGFGYLQCPHDLDTIADLQKIPPLLAGRGYDDEAIQAIMYGNWLRVFRQGWAR